MTVRDPGLQPERTSLAWQRTLLAQVVGAAALLHLAAPGLNGFVLASAAILSASVVVLLVRRRRTRAGRDGGGLPLAVAAGTAALGVAALLAVASGSLPRLLSG